MLEKKYRWTAYNDSDSSTMDLRKTYVKDNRFMKDDYNIEYHARVLAAPSVKDVFIVFHYQNKDGSWSMDMEKYMGKLETYSYSSFYTYFNNTTAYTYEYYQWTNGEQEFTDNVSATNPALTKYNQGDRIYVIRNNTLQNDFDGDGKSYLHVYTSQNQFNLRFANADNNLVKLYYDAPLSNAHNELDNPIKPSSVPAHYVFAGWFTVGSMYDETKLSPDAKMPDHDLVIYAKWEEPHVKVTVEGNGATSELPSVVDIPKLGSVHKDIPNIPSKDGYWFAGWFKDANFTQPFDVNESISHDMTIYAKWVGRQQANWEIRYVDEAGRVLASSVTGIGNLYSVLFENALSIRDYAPDFASKNLTLSSANDTNVLTFVYGKIRTYWVTEDNHNLKDPEYGTKPAEKFEGYTLVRTYTAKNGDIIHLYRKNVPNTGDGANITLFEAMLAMSALGLAALAIAKRKHS